MTSETQETVLDLVQGALKIFHDIAAVDIGESEADEDHFRNSSRTYALAGPVTVGDIRKAALAYEQLAALSRAPEALELGSSTRMTSPASRSQTPLSAGVHGAYLQAITGKRDDLDVLGDLPGIIAEWAYNQFYIDLTLTEARQCARAALSPPSTGGEGEAVAWRCLNARGDAFLTEHANGAYFWAKSGKPVQPLYLHPSPEMGEISREEIAEAVHRGRFPADREPTPFADEDLGGREYCFRIADAILSKLKENGLSREGLGGLARSLPSGDAQERSPVPPLSDGGRV